MGFNTIPQSSASRYFFYSAVKFGEFMCHLNMEENTIQRLKFVSGWGGLTKLFFHSGQELLLIYNTYHEHKSQLNVTCVNILFFTMTTVLNTDL